MSATTTTLPVLISGSGLSGLLVARALATRNIPFHIYERDASAVKRAQGYRLRMSVEGLAAIEAILPADEWKALRAGVSTTAGAGLQQVDANSAKRTDVLAREPPKEEKKDASSSEGGLMRGLGPKGETYGVARGYLRGELMKTIADHVEYGKRVTSYTSDSDGVVVHFSDGTSSPKGSLLIGADGVHSHVTKQLSNGAVRWYDTRTRMIHGQTTTTAFKALGEGVFAISDTSRSDGGTVRVICNVRPDDMDDPDKTFGWTMVGSPGVIDAPGGKFQVVGKVAADLARELTANWHEDIRPIFAEQIESEAGFWKMTTTSPDGLPEWPNDSRVTAVGDAVHSMTPAGGNGANTALQTAAILGGLLRDAGGWNDGLTREFEAKMRPLASSNVAHSVQTARRMFGIGELIEDKHSADIQGPTS